jgi:hypothetical protein
MAEPKKADARELLSQTELEELSKTANEQIKWVDAMPDEDA